MSSPSFSDHFPIEHLQNYHVPIIFPSKTYRNSINSIIFPSSSQSKNFHPPFFLGAAVVPVLAAALARVALVLAANRGGLGRLCQGLWQLVAGPAPQRSPRWEFASWEDQQIWQVGGDWNIYSQFIHFISFYHPNSELTFQIILYWFGNSHPNWRTHISQKGFFLNHQPEQIYVNFITT